MQDMNNCRDEKDRNGSFDDTIQCSKVYGEYYFRLRDCAFLLGGTYSDGDEATPVRQRSRSIKLDGQTYEFVNGGDRIKVPPFGECRPLTKLIIILNGEHYLSMSDFSSTFVGRKIFLDDQQVVVGEKRFKLSYREIRTSANGRAVDIWFAYSLRVATKKLLALSSLDDQSLALSISDGELFQVRRQIIVDQTYYFLCHLVNSPYTSFLLDYDSLVTQTKKSDNETHEWSRMMHWFRDKARSGQALRHGVRAKLPRTIAVTVDLCWSNQHFEEKFFADSLEGEDKFPLTVFVSGRWAEQHPVEMQWLVSQSAVNGFDLTWGGHSWAHPKTSEFLNVMSPTELAEDTLAMERTLLQWGIVPSVFFRFPGLVHDVVRTETLLDFEVLPIDCDAWIAKSREDAESPFHQPVSDGSIVLVHGNGNEVDGIERFSEWKHTAQAWKIARLHEFLPCTR